MKILIVDDSKVITKWNHRILAKLYPEADFEIFILPVKAIEELQNKDLVFDFAFLDYNMPEMDGIELAQVIVEKKWIKSFDQVCMVSANIQKAVENKALALGVTFCEKPLQEQAVREFLISRGQDL
jgi:CheY-like chemotaxis protein